MSENMECVLGDSTPKLHSTRVTCLLDLSDEILHLICRYLSPVFVLYSFYTPEKSNLRLHRVISDYYSKIKLDDTLNYEYNYLLRLVRSSQLSLQLESLILSNEHIPCLIQRYFHPGCVDIVESIFKNLKYLALIHCTTDNISMLNGFKLTLAKLEYLHITVIKSNEFDNINLIKDFIFTSQMSCLHTVLIKADEGLILNKTLIIQKILRNVDLCLQTIDDLYVLLDGLIPNVERLTIQLCQKRILDCSRPKSRPICLQLTEFTLKEPGIGLVIDDMKCLFGFMPNILQLTLSLRNTSDPLFCNGPFFEPILNDSFAHLKQFYYTMTHRMIDEKSIKNFLQWRMNIIFHNNNQHSKWVHIFSLSKFPKQQLSIIKNECDQLIISDLNIEEYIDHIMIQNPDELSELKTRYRHISKLTSSILIDIPLSERISKIIFTEKIPIFSKILCVQPSVHHLIVERRLTNEKEIFNLVHQFPNVQYLKLFLPIEKTLYIRCIKSILHRDHTNEKIYIWHDLINLSTDFICHEFDTIVTGHQISDWLIQNTDLKYHERRFYVDVLFQTILIWF